MKTDILNEYYNTQIVLNMSQGVDVDVNTYTYMVMNRDMVNIDGLLVIKGKTCQMFFYFIKYLSYTCKKLLIPITH